MADAKHTLTDKIAGKIPKSFKKGGKTPPTKITNETIAEHREQILAGGRKFKYPVQYSKHKILINAIIVSIMALAIFSVWSWVMLYRNQATSDFFYSMTKVLPVPVANVDGENVSYQDYLRYVRSDIFYMQNQSKVDMTSDDGKSELEHHKRKELNNVEKIAYARQLARTKNIAVSNQEIDAALNDSLKASKNGATMSQNDYESNVLKQYFGWTIDEYKAVLADRLLEKKVSFAIDTTAKDKINKVKQRLDNGDDFATVAQEMSDDEATRENGGGMSASVDDLDSNSYISMARKLEPGQISGIIEGVDAYYMVKLDSKTDTKVDFLLIKVSLTKFDNDFTSLVKSNKVKEYISIPASEELNI